MENPRFIGGGGGLIILAKVIANSPRNQFNISGNYANMKTIWFYHECKKNKKFRRNWSIYNMLWWSINKCVSQDKAFSWPFSCDFWFKRYSKVDFLEQKKRAKIGNKFLHRGAQNLNIRRLHSPIQILWSPGEESYPLVQLIDKYRFFITSKRNNGPRRFPVHWMLS